MAGRKRTTAAEAPPVCCVKGCEAAVVKRGLCGGHLLDMAKWRGPFGTVAPPGPVVPSRSVVKGGPYTEVPLGTTAVRQHT